MARIEEAVRRRPDTTIETVAEALAAHAVVEEARFWLFSEAMFATFELALAEHVDRAADRPET